jgi:endonuclease/exonuclease/phosphatase family metal-dependent hydrolase
MRLKILTYNIHKGRRGHSRQMILTELKAAIDQTGADIVCLQEVQGMGSGVDEPQFERLADRIWPHYAYARNAITQNGHHGNAILSRFPIKAHSNKNMAWMKGASRSILQAEIEIPEIGLPIHIMCIHMGLLGIERRAQIHALRGQIGLLDPAAPLIVAGDFNDWSGAGHKALRRMGGLNEVSENVSGNLARTFPAVCPVLAVDRIYVRHLTPVSLHMPAGVLWRDLSDHLPLIGQVTWKADIQR